MESSAWGEAAPFLYYAPETAEDVASFVTNVMREQLEGREFPDVRSLMKQFSVLDGHEFAKAAVETALWDLFGKQHGLPVYQLLGGSAQDKVPVLTVLHNDEPATMAQEAAELVASGMTRLKLKIGFGADEDEEKVARVRERVGAGVLIAGGCGRELYDQGGVEGRSPLGAIRSRAPEPAGGTDGLGGDGAPAQVAGHADIGRRGDP